MAEPVATRLLVTKREAAEMLAVGERTIERWLAEGELRSVKLGGRRIAVKELERFVELHRDDDGWPAA